MFDVAQNQYHNKLQWKASKIDFHSDQVEIDFHSDQVESEIDRPPPLNVLEVLFAKFPKAGIRVEEFQ
jgi:hypothetical protein